MKLTVAISSLLIVLPLFSSVLALPEPGAANHLIARQQGGRGNGNNNKGKGGKKGGKANASSTAAAAAQTTAAAAGNGTAAGNNNNNNGGGDPQTSLTLDPKVIAPGFASDGQQVPTAGQVASLTSTNNFINFCLTVNKPITNGQQIKTGSCNPAPMGVIAAQTNMPSSKFTNPKNGQTLPANTPFTITMAINHLQAGNFVNAQSNYYSAPQQVNGGGDIIGHTHVVVEALTALDQTTPTDPTIFAFFKGVNGAAVNGVVSADVTAGLPAGVYRLASINAAANHQPVLVAVAQHGSLDDMVYFTVADGGAAAAGNATAGGAAAAAASAPAGGNGTAAATTTSNAAAAATTTSNAAAAATTKAAGKGKKGGRSFLASGAY